MKRALISVSNKSGLIEFAKGLSQLGYEIISTGGTKKALEESDLHPLSISEITNFPEIMNGRVKTLHPNVHGALLCDRDKSEHITTLKDNRIEFIDLLCVNLYPFVETMNKDQADHQDILENIDIGGPAMIRSAAKNHKWISVVCDPRDYADILEEIEKNGDISQVNKAKLASKAFRHTAAYDSYVASYLSKIEGVEYPEKMSFTYEKVQDLRYGENPHQKSAFYKKTPSGYSVASCQQIQGKELSYNNIQDASAALDILREFSNPCAVAVKHMNPCGIGEDSTIYDAWKKAFSSDSISIFGGILAFNREVDENIARELKEIFLEIIIAPSFSPDAIKLLSTKQNLRLLILDINLPILEKQRITWINGGLLIQELDNPVEDIQEFRCVTDVKPSQKLLEDLLFAWKSVKHVKSNGIVIAKNSMTIGIGAGQMNRVGAAKIALEQASKLSQGAVMASDAFFPMSDTVELSALYGIKAIIQPGGSIKDELSIQVCNKYGIAMIFTDIRHFKH